MKQLFDCRFLQLNTFKIEKGYQPKNALIFLESGCIKYTMAGKREQAGPHQLLSFPERVYFERKIEEPASFYYVRYENPGEEPLPAGLLPLENTGRLLSTLQYLLRLTNIPGEQELKNALLADIFHQLRAEELLQPAKLDPVIARLTGFFEKNLHRKLSLGEAAAAVCLSPNGLIHHCKKQLRLTPMDYLNRLRLERAEALLCRTADPIAHIARLCGFESPYYFSNVFKKARGISPAAYRKKYTL